MASIQYLTKRITGKKAEIAKLEKRLERIREAKATGWEVNPYCYGECDLAWTGKDLESARAKLSEYETALAEAQAKANSRTVKPVLDFLQTWQDKMFTYYNKAVKEYFEDAESLSKEYEALHQLIHSADLSTDHSKYEAVKAQRAKVNTHAETRRCKLAGYNEDRTTTRFGRPAVVKVKVQEGEWEYARHYFKKTYDESVAYLKKDLKEEADRKYDDMIDRIVHVTGEITDASNLSVAAKGELNGFIVGKKGAALIETIGAGGYNIQCFHFRTLVKPFTGLIKEN